MTGPRALGPALALAMLAVPTAAPAAEGTPFAVRQPVDAGHFAAQVAEICLDALPDLEGVSAALDAGGFGPPDAAGFRLHEARAIAAMALTPAEAPAGAAPVCMVVAPEVPFEAAEAALAERLEARFDGVDSDESAAIDLRHRVWLWQGDGGTVKLVLTLDGRGHLGAVVALPPSEGGT